jgi:hypothetical protein
VGDEEEILSWPRPMLEGLVKDMKPIVELHKKAVAKLKETAK